MIKELNAPMYAWQITSRVPVEIGAADGSFSSWEQQARSGDSACLLFRPFPVLPGRSFQGKDAWPDLLSITFSASSLMAFVVIAALIAFRGLPLMAPALLRGAWHPLLNRRCLLARGGLRRGFSRTALTAPLRHRALLGWRTLLDWWPRGAWGILRLPVPSLLDRSRLILRPWRGGPLPCLGLIVPPDDGVAGLVTVILVANCMLLFPSGIAVPGITALIDRQGGGGRCRPAVPSVPATVLALPVITPVLAPTGRSIRAPIAKIGWRMPIVADGDAQHE